MSDPRSNTAPGAPAAAAPKANPTNPATPSSPGRKVMMTLLTIVILIAAVAYGFYYFLYARFYESTDDAYVNGHLVEITAQVPGTVIAVNADDTQTVKAGDPLVALDPADSKVTLDEAEANLAQTVRQVHTLFVNNNTYEADVAQRQTQLSQAQDDLRRRMTVAQTGAVSGEEIAHAQDAVKNAVAALEASEQQLASNRVLTENTSVARHPNVLAAASKVRDAYLNFARNTLPAPVSGYVAKNSVHVGQRISPGTPLMAIVPLTNVWVDANFKEVQLKHMHVGQPVELTADVYGSSVIFHGKVIGFSAGTGSAFSLLPAQNATGNWIKVVQRLPVRIALDPQELEKHPLRVGLSINAEVNVRNDNGSQMPPAPNSLYQTNVFEKYGDQADAEIARIIAANLGAQNDAALPPSHVGRVRRSTSKLM